MKGVRKENLPTKVCAACGRPFTWRKKWERDWDNVRYCSDRCRASRSHTDNSPGSQQNTKPTR